MSDRIVIHPRYGRGIVQQSRYKGFELRVSFGDGITRWVRLDELTEAKALYPTPHIAPRVPPAFSNECFKYRRMIEAFRLGVVPYDCVKDFTFGREEETNILMDWLNESEEGTLLVVGEYGTGKSHLLHYAYGRALQSGFAVAYIEMDPDESPFYKPKRVYSRLIRTLRFRSMRDSQLRSFRSFLKEAITRGAFTDHRYFKHLINKTSDESLWNWIEASESIVRPWDADSCNWSYPWLPGMYDYSTAANIYCYLLSALGWAAKETLGLKGLLLIFDEAETVEIHDCSYRVDSGYNFMKALIRVANNDSRLLRTPHNVGLGYCRVGEGSFVPFIYKKPSGLKLLFAFTDIHAPDQLFESRLVRRIDLEPLTDVALKEVFEHICLIYDSAYDFLEEDVTIDAIFRRVKVRSGHTRLFVKGSIEALDLIRHGNVLDEVLR